MSAVTFTRQLNHRHSGRTKPSQGLVDLPNIFFINKAYNYNPQKIQFLDIFQFEECVVFFPANCSQAYFQFQECIMRTYLWPHTRWHTSRSRKYRRKKIELKSSDKNFAKKSCLNEKFLHAFSSFIASCVFCQKIFIGLRLQNIWWKVLLVAHRGYGVCGQRKRKKMIFFANSHHVLNISINSDEYEPRPVQHSNHSL